MTKIYSKDLTPTIVGGNGIVLELVQTSTDVLERGTYEKAAEYIGSSLTSLEPVDQQETPSINIIINKDKSGARIIITQVERVIYRSEVDNPIIIRWEMRTVISVYKYVAKPTETFLGNLVNEIGEHFSPVVIEITHEK
jgi:hypothetical protein